MLKPVKHPRRAIVPVEQHRYLVYYSRQVIESTVVVAVNKDRAADEARKVIPRGATIVYEKGDPKTARLEPEPPATGDRFVRLRAGRIADGAPLIVRVELVTWGPEVKPPHGPTFRELYVFYRPESNPRSKRRPAQKCTTSADFLRRFRKLPP